MHHLTRSIFVCALATVLSTLLLVTEVAQAAPLTCGTWSVVSSPNVGSGDSLSSVTAISASNVWAVGDYYNSSNILRTLIEQWNGSSWSVVSSPNVGSHGDFLTGVAAVSASNVWAVGDYYNSSNNPGTLIEHWNGSSWKVVKSPNVGSFSNFLTGVAAISANNVWAVGYYNNGRGDQTLIEHWSGISWSVVPGPNPTQSQELWGIAVASATNIWAVGSQDPGETLIEHWNGSNWSVVSSPNVGSNGNDLYGVVVVSTSDVWAVGNYWIRIGIQRTLIEHWNGSNWSVVSSPNVGSNDNVLFSLTALSASNVWAVGYYLKGQGAQQTLIEHWNGSNWSVVSSPNVGSSNNLLSGVARALGSSNVWAVGYGSSGTLTEFYC